MDQQDALLKMINEDAVVPQVVDQAPTSDAVATVSDAVAAAQAPNDVAAPAVVAEQVQADVPITAAPDASAIDLTPAAIVNPTDLDKKGRGGAKKHDEIAAVEAAKKRRQEREHAAALAEEQADEEQMLMEFDDEDEDDYLEEEEEMDVDPRTEEPEKAKKKAASSSKKSSDTKPKSKAKPKVKKTAADTTKKGASSKKRASGKSESSKKRSKKSSAGAGTSDEEPAPRRRQPGHLMIKAEYDRLTRALDTLVGKRVQYEESNGGEPSTTVRAILINNLVDFYEQDVLIPFERKFARYMN